jgi:hypothetical protein
VTERFDIARGRAALRIGDLEDGALERVRHVQVAFAVEGHRIGHTGAGTERDRVGGAVRVADRARVRYADSRDDRDVGQPGEMRGNTPLLGLEFDRANKQVYIANGGNLAGVESKIQRIAADLTELTPEDCLGQYAFTKRACQAGALRDIVDLADPLDGELPDGMTSDQARHAHRRYWQQLKGSPAPW